MESFHIGGDNEMNSFPIWYKRIALLSGIVARTSERYRRSIRERRGVLFHFSSLADVPKLVCISDGIRFCFPANPNNLRENARGRYAR